MLATEATSQRQDALMQSVLPRKPREVYDATIYSRTVREGHHTVLLPHALHNLSISSKVNVSVLSTG